MKRNGYGTLATWGCYRYFVAGLDLRWLLGSMSCHGSSGLGELIVCSHSRFLFKKWFVAMIRVPLLIVALFLGQYSIAQRPVTTAKRYAVVLASITRIIPKHHLSHMPNGDVISMRAFDMMFDQMDPRRLYFTDEDVQALLKYRDGLDDQAFKGKFDFAEELHERFLERVGKAEIMLPKRWLSNMIFL